MLLTHPLLAVILDLGAAEPARQLQALRFLLPKLATPGFLELLRSHRLTPLVYATLSRFPRRALGEVPCLAELRRDYLRHYRGYVRQEEETRALGRALAAAGVEAILLKGGELRHLLYEDPACRPMADVDVLIPPADLDRARRILAGCGYRRVAADQERLPDFNRRFAWEELYEGPPGSGVYFDLHWEIRKMGAYYRMPYDFFRARARPPAGANGGFFSPAPEHLVLNMCLDSLEEWERASLLRALDLKRAVERLPLDWELLLAEAAALRVEGALAVLFRSLITWCPGAVPSWVLDRLTACSPDWLERRLLRRERGSFLWGAVATLTRHVPLRDWPAYLRGKLWPQPSFVRLNYGNRKAYLQHLLKRCRDRT